MTLIQGSKEFCLQPNSIKPLKGETWPVQHEILLPRCGFALLTNEMGKLGEVIEGLRAQALDQSRGRSSVRDSSGSKAADGFDAAINRKSQGGGKHVAATAAIDGLIERGVRHVREIDALVRNTLASDPSALAAWESASHVEKPARKSRQKPTTPAPAQR